MTLGQATTDLEVEGLTSFCWWWWLGVVAGEESTWPCCLLLKCLMYT